jgi:transposase
MFVHYSMQGFSPPKIARMVFLSPAWVRRVVRDFNRMGTAALYPHRAGGRPPTFTLPQRQQIKKGVDPLEGPQAARGMMPSA